MFENFDEFLKGNATLEVDANGKTTERGLQISTACLLVHMANVDDNLTENELNAMVSGLNTQFKLSDKDAGDILEVADFLRRNENKLGDVLVVINERFTDTQKRTVLAMLWKIMLADGSVSGNEAEMAARVSDQLGLSKEDIQAAKEMADSGQV